jgi:hypothetical protein
VAGVPERHPVTHDAGPRRSAATAGLRPRVIRLRMASTVEREPVEARVTVAIVFLPLS